MTWTPATWLREQSDPGESLEQKLLKSKQLWPKTIRRRNALPVAVAVFAYLYHEFAKGASKNLGFFTSVPITFHGDRFYVMSPVVAARLILAKISAYQITSAKCGAPGPLAQQI